MTQTSRSRASLTGSSKKLDQPEDAYEVIPSSSDEESSGDPPSQASLQAGSTQFNPSADGQMFKALSILEEKGKKYLIDWAGTDPETGKHWEPTWEPKGHASNKLIAVSIDPSQRHPSLFPSDVWTYLPVVEESPGKNTGGATSQRRRGFPICVSDPSC